MPKKNKYDTHTEPVARTRKKKNRATLFPRHITVPTRVQAASELWLEMFQGFCDGLLMRKADEDERNTNVRALDLTGQARELADAALHQFEDRWPEVKL